MDVNADPDGSSFLSESVQGRWVNVILVIVMLTFFADTLLLTVIVPLAPELKSHYNLVSPGAGDAAENAADLKIGLLFSAKAAVQILLSPLTAKLVDRFSMRGVFVPAGCVLVGTTVLYAASGKEYGLALAARALQGIGSSGILVSGQAGLTAVAPEDNQGAMIATAMLGCALGVLFGPTVGGALAQPQALGLQNMFWFMACVIGVIVVADALVLWRMPQPVVRKLSKGAAGEERVGTRKLLRRPLIWALIFGNFGVNFGISMLEPATPNRAVDRFGIDSQETGTLGVMWLAAPLGFILMTPPAGMLADRFDKGRVMALGLVLMGIGLVIWQTAYEKSAGGIAQFEVGLVACGLGYALTNNAALAAVPSVAGEEGVSAGFGLVDVAEQLGFILGPVISGAVGYRGGLLGLLVVMWAAFAGGVAVLLCSRFPQAPSEPAAPMASSADRVSMQQT